jgi:hypothetical protein
MATEETIDIDVLDTRLTDSRTTSWYCKWTKGGDPDKRLRVDENIKLDSFLDTVKSRLRGRKLGVLSILAHGFGVLEYPDRAKKGEPKIHGGFGIEFCEENLLLTTVEQFKKLKGVFSNRDLGIILMGCAAAAEDRFLVAPGTKEYKTGFGKQLCSKLAAVTDTGVMASESLQEAKVDTSPRTYRWGNDIQEVASCVEFPGWKGTLLVFSPNGKMKRVQSG